MLHPNQFIPNEAWILFKLNDAPILTEADGDFNIFALMDAASCFILSSTLISITQTEPSQLEAKRLLKEARAHLKQLPKTLFIPVDQPAKSFAAEAKRQGIAVTLVQYADLQPIVGEAIEGFKEEFGGSSIH